MSVQASQFIGSSWAGAWAPLLASGLSGGWMFCDEGFAPIGYDRDNLWDGNEWPVSRLRCNGDNGAEQHVFEQCDWGNRMLWPSGNSSYPYCIQGNCLDEAGNPLGAVSLRVFRAIDEVLLYELEYDGVRDSPTNNVDGSFKLGVPDSTTDYYIVAYRSGPERAGSTVRNLRGVPW
jgi:hypothetical protein